MLECVGITCDTCASDFKSRNSQDSKSRTGPNLTFGSYQQNRLHEDFFFFQPGNFLGGYHEIKVFSRGLSGDDSLLSAKSRPHCSNLSRRNIKPLRPVRSHKCPVISLGISSFSCLTSRSQIIILPKISLVARTDPYCPIDQFPDLEFTSTYYPSDYI